MKKIYYTGENYLQLCNEIKKEGIGLQCWNRYENYCDVEEWLTLTFPSDRKENFRLYRNTLYVIDKQGIAESLPPAAKDTYLLNAFSLQMLEGDCNVKIEVINQPKNLIDYKSAVGHADTARVLGVKEDRINVKLETGDCAIVAQLQGGRLPEGSTTLPENFFFKFYRVSIL